MFKAIFYTTASSFNRYKTAANVVQAHDPFNMIVLDSVDKTPGLSSEIKNVIEFSDLTAIPTNRVFVNWGTSDPSKYEAVINYCKTNKIKIIYDHYNKGILTLELPRNTDWVSFNDKFQTAVPLLQWVEEDLTQPIELYAAYTYNQHWHLGNIEAQFAWDSAAANSAGASTSQVEVSIIDGGVDINHPDLVGKISSQSWNVINNNSDVSPSGIYDNHATAVAGIIAANNANSNYVLSLTNDRVKVRVIKAFYFISNGISAYQSLSQLVEAIDRAGNQAASICMAFGSPNASATIQLAITNEIERSNSCKGVVFFAAAGNMNVTSIPYPAAYEGVIAIGASTSANTKASWSNYGSGIYMAAPGVGIRTTDRTGTDGYSTSSSTNPTTNADLYNTELATTIMSGTSASVAIAAGVAGVIKSVNPNLLYQEVINIMKNAAYQGGGYDYSDGGKSLELGYGIVRMANAVDTAIELASVPEGYTMDFSVTSCPTPVIAGNTISVTCVAEGTGPIWGDIYSIKLEYYASPFPYFLTTSATLIGYNWFYNIVDGANSLTASVTLPNSGTMSSTNYLVVKAIARDYCGNELGGLINNGNDYFFYEASAPMSVQIPAASPDLAVQILSVSTTSTGMRIYTIKYTNVGVIPITSFNRSYGWIGGSSTSNTQTYPGTTTTNGPLLPGQSRTIYISYNSPAPQYPATYFHQINSVNGVADGNLVNNYASITVNQ
jgi:subtilisin family serine protease